MDTFDHEKLEVYKALQFLVLADQIVHLLPPGRAYIKDELQRASSSQVLNIAEGAGEFSRKEKARFYRMAKRSATECAGLLDMCRDLQLVPADLLNPGRQFLLRIVSMLIRMIRNLGEPDRSKAGE